MKFFTKAFEKAELAKFNQMDSYEYSLKVFKDNKATFDYAMTTAKDLAYDEGRLAGELAGKIAGTLAGKLEGT